MSDEVLVRDVLTWLLENYRVDSNGSYDIGAVCRKHSADSVSLSDSLRLQGLIKDEVNVEGGSVKCSISMKGIAMIETQFVEGLIDKVLSAMAGVNSINNIMAILKLEQKDFQLAFDLANEMQNRDLVKLLYAFQPGKMVNVEMTLEGVRRKRL